MSCQDCGSKTKSRYAPRVTVVGDVDAKTVTEQPQPYPRQEARTRNDFHPAPPMSPMEFEEAERVTRAMSFEELYDALAKRREDVAKVVEEDLKSMTAAIKRVHVVSLVEVANFELNPLLAMNPDQAIINLKMVLDREDFKDINDLYPGLKDQVEARYQELISKRLTI